MNNPVITSCLVISAFVAAVGAAEPDSVTAVDFSKPIGKLRALHGVNNGPVVVGNHTADMVARHREAGFPSARLHDCHWPNPNVVDIPAIFPLFHADADNPSNYIFAPTDHYLKPIVDNGEQIVYRLGVSIEHKTTFRTAPPEDFAKWAKICVNVIRHYNDGWANGYHYNIRQFEIWNEPEGSQMWQGSMEQYFDLYRVAATAIKAYNPELKVGGPVATCPSSGIVKPFLAYCRDRKLPLDFFSWHCYTDSVSALLDTVRSARAVLDAYGFQKSESLCTEWRPMLAGFDQVAWTPDRPAMAVRDAFERNRNHEAAAFAASALLQMQDSPLDMAHFYTADDSPWSMFNEYGVPGKVFFAFKAFNQFLQTPNRVAVTGASSGDGLTLGAGLSDDGKRAALLVSNYRSPQKSAKIALQKLPWAGATRAEIWRVDAANDFQRTSETTLTGDAAAVELETPPGSVTFVRLNQP